MSRIMHNSRCRIGRMILSIEIYLSNLVEGLLLDKLEFNDQGRYLVPCCARPQPHASVWDPGSCDVWTSFGSRTICPDHGNSAPVLHLSDGEPIPQVKAVHVHVQKVRKFRIER